MKSTAETYHDAAMEHIAHAQWLFEEQRYCQAHWFAGLAVECILRAVLRHKTATFGSRHELSALATESGILERISPDVQESFGANLNLLNLRWHSNQRFFPESALWRYLSNIRADFGRKGDAKRNRSRSLIEAALYVIHFGDAAWRSLSASRKS